MHSQDHFHYTEQDGQQENAGWAPVPAPHLQHCDKAPLPSLWLRGTHPESEEDGMSIRLWKTAVPKPSELDCTMRPSALKQEDIPSP